MPEALRDLRQRHAAHEHAALPVLERRVVHVDAGQRPSRHRDLAPQDRGLHACAARIVVGGPGGDATREVGCPRPIEGGTHSAPTTGALARRTVGARLAR